MKTAGWSTYRVAVQVDRLECAVRNGWEQCTLGRTGLERPGKPRGERIEGSHLAEANLKSKRPFRALPLTPEHRQLRLQWCQAKSMGNVTDWQKVVFSDESRFVLGTDNNRVRVWWRPELAGQDLWAHMPQDNIRCLINSMPVRVAACIAAGGGPTRY
ncbi:uncharacterized protein TNCV_1224681 [Trichonephila clavipes]|nr:uncharacterized protein TNCV_1224681 [Trichonephila clavipes]